MVKIDLTFDSTCDGKVRLHVQLTLANQCHYTCNKAAKATALPLLINVITLAGKQNNTCKGNGFVPQTQYLSVFYHVSISVLSILYQSFIKFIYQYNIISRIYRSFLQVILSQNTSIHGTSTCTPISIFFNILLHNLSRIFT